MDDFGRTLAAVSLANPGLEAEFQTGLGRDSAVAAGEDDDEPIPDDPPHVTLRRVEQRPISFDYQDDLAEQALNVLIASPPNNVGLLTLPTGAGKTRTALLALGAFFKRNATARSRQLVAVWMAPTRELLSQALDTARRLWLQDPSLPDLDLLRTDLGAQIPALPKVPTVVFTTPQKLYSAIRRSRNLPDTAVVIFDEAHHLGAPTFQEVVTRIRGAGGGRPALLGLSATPGRTSDDETHRLVDMFGGRLLRSEALNPNAVRVLQRRGVLSALEFKRIEVETRNSAIKPSEPQRMLAIRDLYARNAINGKSLVFAASIRHAHLIAALIRLTGRRAEAISSSTERDRRRSLLVDFQSGSIDTLVCKSLLATGYDAPGVGDVVLTKTIASAILFEQIVGRASRGPAVGGGARARIWEFEDHRALHGLPSSYYRYSDFDWT